MVEQLISFAKSHFYFVLMAIGLFIMIGSILDWKWLTRMESTHKLLGIRTFIEKLHGVEAKYKFERFVTFFSGLIILSVGVFFWYLYWRYAK